MGENITELTEINFRSEVLESALPVLIDFWAEWCGPCKMIAPIIDEIASEYQGKIAVGKVDADSNIGITQKYGVMSLPTLLLFKAGEPVVRITGYQAKGKILGKLEDYI